MSIRLTKLSEGICEVAVSSNLRQTGVVKRASDFVRKNHSEHSAFLCLFLTAKQNESNKKFATLTNVMENLK
jgi:hypothetical protein